MESVGVSQLFGGVYSGRKVFITGITGFKGSWLAVVLESLGAEVYGFALPPRTSDDHFNFLKLESRTQFGNILEPEALQSSFEKSKPEIVFHLAAQPLVRASYADPILTYQTNVMGSLQVYEAARRSSNVAALVSVTTDKVYENKEQNISYREQDPLGGHDPYSSSKACVEILTQSYRKSFLDSVSGSYLLASARAGNVIGGGDWAEDRLVPDLVRSVRDRRELMVRNPLSVRPWQHVLEPLMGYLQLGQRLLQGERGFADAFNFGPSEADSCSVDEVLKRFKSRWSDVNYRTEVQESALHEAGLLKLDSSKSHQRLLWRPRMNLEAAVAMTADWYRSYLNQDGILTRKQVEAYLGSMV